MTALRRYFTAQIEEIRQDPALRIYGALLAFGQLLSFFNWMERHAALSLSNTGGAICWPFFESCYAYRFLDYYHVKLVLLVFALASAIGSGLFLSRQHTETAYWWLVLLNVFKTLVYFQDYRLRMNQHYMLYWSTLVFLFLPHKRLLLRYILVCFYVGASVLKYNPEWLSGKALYAKPLGVPLSWVPASCAYVVVLESYISWGVLAANPWIYWAALAQLYLFHVCSWTIVGPFYPMLMFSLLLIFPLTRFLPAAGEPKGLFTHLFRGRAPRAAYAMIAAFALCQLVPWVMPGDEKITGEGRLFALHMFDARVECEGAITLHFRNGRTEQIPIPMNEKTRIKCDPVVNFSQAKRLCYEHRADADFLDLDLVYQARRAHQPAMRPLVNVHDFCSQHLSYDVLRPNDWILKD